MIEQSLLNTNETCYSVQIIKICNLNKALLKKLEVMPLLPTVGYIGRGQLRRARLACDRSNWCNTCLFGSFSARLVRDFVCLPAHVYGITLEQRVVKFTPNSFPSLLSGIPTNM